MVSGGSLQFPGSGGALGLIVYRQWKKLGFLDGMLRFLAFRDALSFPLSSPLSPLLCMVDPVARFGGWRWINLFFAC
ncbi:hypothetical protein VNO77_32096 [Canavalia gladiata]|uniref:Uncharacterized protein n=1 Tax=Canavalia gladiata TaxID=3824 RepID=A0AAN9KT27_CANGL